MSKLGTRIPGHAPILDTTLLFAEVPSICPLHSPALLPPMLYLEPSSHGSLLQRFSFQKETMKPHCADTQGGLESFQGLTRQTLLSPPQFRDKEATAVLW